MGKVFISAFFVLALAAIVTEATSCTPLYKDCGSVKGKVLDVAFNGSCTADKHVELKEGTYVGLDIKLQSAETSKTLTASVHGIIAGVSIPFPLPNANACQDSNINCPIASGKEYVYAPSIYVKKSYPKLKLVIKWQVIDDNKQNLICILLPAVITS